MQIALGKDNAALELRTKATAIRLGADVVIGDFTIPGSGEYEVCGVMAEAGPQVVRLDAGELVVGYLRPTGAGKVSENDLEELGAVDVVCVPVGGDGLAPKEAAGLIGQLEARLVIPLAQEEAAIDRLCASGVVCEKQVGTLKVTRNALSGEGTKVLRLTVS